MTQLERAPTTGQEFLTGVDMLDLPHLSDLLQRGIAPLRTGDVAQLPDDIRDLFDAESVNIIASKKVDIVFTERSITISVYPPDPHSVTVWAHHASPLKAEYSQNGETIPLYEDTEEGKAKTASLAEVLLRLAQAKFPPPPTPTP